MAITGTYEASSQQEADAINQSIKIVQDIVKHGFGVVEIHISEVKHEFKTKIIIKAGRSWLYFIEKSITKFKDNIIFSLFLNCRC